MIYLSHSRPSSPSFYPSHLLFLFFSICLLLFPSSFITAQQIAATGLPTTLTLPLAAPLTATVTYSVNAQSTLVVSLIQTLQNNERSVGESSTTVNAGNNQQTTVTNIRIPTNLPSSGPGITYKWRIYSVNPDTYSFSPSIAFNARTASQEQTGITVTAAAPATTLPPTTTTIRATTIIGQSTTTAKAGVSTTTAKAGVSTTRTTTRPITTLRSTLAPGGGGPGDQPVITDPPTGTIYKIISSTAVAGRMGMCAYTYQDGDTLSDIVIKLETTLGRLIQLNLDKFQQADYVPQAGDVLQYDCFIAEGSQTDDDGSAPITRPPGSSQQQRSSSSSNKSWVDNNVVIFIVLLVVGFCLLAFLSIVLYKHIQAQFSTDKNTKKMVTEARAAPPMSTPANRNWGTTNA